MTNLERELAIELPHLRCGTGRVHLAVDKADITLCIEDDPYYSIEIESWEAVDELIAALIKAGETAFGKRRAGAWW